MRRIALALGLAALAACTSDDSEPCATCAVPPGGPVQVTGPFVNETSFPVFLGSAAPPKDLALESLTLSTNAELLVPEVFGQTPIVDRILPGGGIALSSQTIIIAATTTMKASNRRASLVSFIANGTEGRVLLVGTNSGMGRAAIREVDGQLTIVPLDRDMAVYPIRRSAKPACSDAETKRTLEWTDRAGTATIATQTWAEGCIDVTFVGDPNPFHACLPQDAWPFQPSRTLTFTPYAKRGVLAETTNSQGERGVTITDGETTLELGLVKAPLSWSPPLDGNAELAVEATKHCLTVEPTCSQVTTPIAVSFVEQDARRALEVGVPFERTLDGERVTHRLLGGRLIPVHRMECDGEASGYSMELVTLRRPK